MSTHKLALPKIERITLSPEQLEVEQFAKSLSGNAHLTDEQFRELVCKGFLVIEAPISGPESKGNRK